MVAVPQIDGGTKGSTLGTRVFICVPYDMRETCFPEPVQVFVERSVQWPTLS